MTLHDKVAVEAYLSAASYLLGRVSVLLDDAWKKMIEDVDFTCHTEFRDALDAVRTASAIASELENKMKENMK